MLTRSGLTLGIGGPSLIVFARVFGLFELFVLGAAATGLVLAAGLAVLVQRPRKLTVRRVLRPARVHAGRPSRVELDVASSSRLPTPVMRLSDPVSGTRGANLWPAPVRRGEPVTAGVSASHRAARGGRDRAAQGRDDRPLRAGAHRHRHRRSGRAGGVPANRRDPTTARGVGPRPAPRSGDPERARTLGRGLLRVAPVRRRRRSPQGALALERAPRRAGGAPGRAPLAGSYDRRARQPPRVLLRRQLRGRRDGHGERAGGLPAPRRPHTAAHDRGPRLGLRGRPRPRRRCRCSRWR